MQVCIIMRGVRGGGSEGAAAPQKHLSLEKLSKFLSNSTKIREIFAEISDKLANLYLWVG